MDRWGLIEGLRSQLAKEQGTLVKDAPLKVALCYPSPYSVGMSSLGFQAIYREVHEHPGATAERAFLPDDVEAFKRTGCELLTLETQSPVSQSSIVAFSVAYELELTGLFEVLALAGIPLLRAERGAAHPLIVAGGPLTFSNPAPLEPFVDLVVLGEADETIHQLLEAARTCGTKEATLAALDGKPGFHVPASGKPMPALGCTADERLPARSQILTPDTELSSMFLVEAERGCSRGCTYCVMRRSTNGGMRLIPPERVLAAVPEGVRKVGLVGAAVTDHPKLREILEALVRRGLEVGMSSMRAERLDPELVNLLARAGYRTLTVALDGASKRLRDTIDRRTDEKDILRAAELAKAGGLKRIKVYMMVGLPTETEADLDELRPLHARAGRRAAGLAGHLAVLRQAPHAAGRRALRAHRLARVQALAAAEGAARQGRGAGDVRPLGVGRVPARPGRSRGGPGGDAGVEGRRRLRRLQARVPGLTTSSVPRGCSRRTGSGR
ncbi:MAG: radical SAM protein [Myxococcales bacterium]